MTRAGTEIAGATSAQDAARDWQALRADSAIQYAPLPPYKPPPRQDPPDWLLRVMEWIGRALEAVFKPIGDFIGLSWPVMQKVAIAAAVLAVLAIAWFLVIRPLLERQRRPRADDAEPEWAPDRTEAEILLADADRLAAEGRYGEAAHLLLQRSVQHIAAARPDWLDPASTAREIAVLPPLPERARQAFAAIATRVERSLFALRDLDLADWQAARAAYADFALQSLPGAAG